MNPTSPSDRMGSSGTTSGAGGSHGSSGTTSNVGSSQGSSGAGSYGSSGAGGSSGGQGSGRAGSLGAQASGAARDLQNQASGAIDQVSQQIKDQAAGIADSARGFVSQAGEKLLSSVEEQKTQGAEFVSGIAGAIRRAAREFESEVPQAAQYIRRAADQVDSVSNAMRRRDMNDLVSGVQDFARRQPTAFLGATVLAGFALVRFLKSSTGSSGTSYQGMSGSGGYAGGYGQSRGSYPGHYPQASMGGGSVGGGAGSGYGRPGAMGQGGGSSTPYGSSGSSGYGTSSHGAGSSMPGSGAGRGGDLGPRSPSTGQVSGAGGSRPISGTSTSGATGGASGGMSGGASSGAMSGRGEHGSGDPRGVSPQAPGLGLGSSGGSGQKS